MASPFDRMAERMDASTIKKMGKIATINGHDYDVVPAELLEDMGPVNGMGTSLVVFFSDYEPQRNDAVVYDGKSLIVTRYERFNGKPRIYIE